MNNKYIAILAISVGVLFFGFAVALSSGWDLTSSTSEVLVSGTGNPLERSVSVELGSGVVEPVIGTVEIGEITVTSPGKKSVKATVPEAIHQDNPGAARRRPTESLESPTGLASEKALSYQPSFSHPVRSMGLRMRSQGFSSPIRERPKQPIFEVFEVE
jgi:hypothetical protein